jgi:peptidoglycan/xylan/chitin deacetylase (PgdA/CDA1 family)
MLRRRSERQPGQRVLMAVLLLAAGAALIAPSTFWLNYPPPAAETSLPTAQVIVPSPRRIDTAVPERAQLSTPAPRPTDTPEQPPEPAVTPSPTVEPPASAASPRPPSTPTITPIPLPTIQGPAPPATLIPTQAVVNQAAAGAIPILMYHYIRDVDRASDPLGYELSLSPALFEQHMAWLHEHGYTTVRVDMLVRCLRAEEHCPPRSIALTFDDGYADAYTTVLPILRAYGFTATFYVVSSFVGRPGYMGWDELAALRDAGMQIGAHSVDHLDLTQLDPQSAAWQIAQSGAELARGLGIDITSFCYPAGLYDAAIVAQTRAAGYQSAVTTRWDSDISDLFALPRRRVAGNTSAESFAALVQE